MVIDLSIFNIVSPVISPVNEPVKDPVFVANNSFDSFMQIVVPSTLTPIESPSINSKRSALKLVCPLNHEPDLFIFVSETGYEKAESVHPSIPAAKSCFSPIDWLCSP